MTETPDELKISKESEKIDEEISNSENSNS